ncbi:hypothetical protein GGD83_002815 [Rhodoblastus sphagnicola]|nr:hypothetical protein [Rhodoblastus sphagnicola]MBB4199004.1 hypothetical protein [Rhodoblastus sphagnicola]
MTAAVTATLNDLLRFRSFALRQAMLCQFRNMGAKIGVRLFVAPMREG